MKDSPSTPQKIEESATRSDTHAPIPTRGHVEKAAAFLRAWPPADRMYPDYTRDPTTLGDCTAALASLIADEVDEHAREREAMAGELHALREALRLSAGALSDVVQLAGRPDVRAVLDAYGAGTTPLASAVGKLPAGAYRVNAHGVDRVALLADACEQRAPVAGERFAGYVCCGAKDHDGPHFVTEGGAKVYAWASGMRAIDAMQASRLTHAMWGNASLLCGAKDRGRGAVNVEALEVDTKAEADVTCPECRRVLDEKDDDEERVMASARMGAAERATIEGLERALLESRTLNVKLTTERDEARAECERLTRNLSVLWASA